MMCFPLASLFPASYFPVLLSPMNLLWRRFRRQLERRIPGRDWRQGVRASFPKDYHAWDHARRHFERDVRERQSMEELTAGPRSLLLECRQNRYPSAPVGVPEADPPWQGNFQSQPWGWHRLGMYSRPPHYYPRLPRRRAPPDDGKCGTGMKRVFGSSASDRLG